MQGVIDSYMYFPITLPVGPILAGGSQACYLRVIVSVRGLRHY